MEKMKVSRFLYESFEKERKKYKTEQEFKEQILKKIYLSKDLNLYLCSYEEYFLVKCVMYGYELEITKEDIK